MLSKIKDIELVGSFQSPSEAYAYIQENKVDMAFVDINMREENGLDFVRRVTAQYKEIAIFFLTAYKEYALEAYGMHAFDYIVKPITFERLENSIQKAKDTLIFLQPSNRNNKNKILFNCLGGLDVKSTSGGSIQFTSSKSSELMAYLVMHRGRLVSKWRIMEDVFNGMAQSNAETYLNTTVYKLRKALEPHGMKSAIISAEESYKIDLNEVYADIIDFEDRITSIYQLDESNLEKAIQTEKLYSGELFGEKDYSWSLPEKERISEVYFSFAKKLVNYLIDNMKLTVALHITKKLNNFNELDEEINYLLMKIYSLQKNRSLLERQYERYKKILKSELGLSPDNSMVELYHLLIKSFG
ncbi:response regulator [Anaerocolumna sedimenticola]|uniref:Stage 0 sporulation protein A homolog n=1 Tax=Anaerocolumna sedimenticola TaxID=2696063 RepID=A0A6P1TJ61_9FIRM|nr:response regulator [Anaerocolumna sedimenticola]QHQ61240.1 response regulator [Anaerocolumna sedimenticola]